MMKFALFTLAVVSAAEEATDAELKEAALDETDEAIKNIEDGLLIGKIGTDEKAEYDACMKDKTLPDKTTDKVNHLLMLNSCYNTVGKKTYGCQGNRRVCGEGMCCGK